MNISSYYDVRPLADGLPLGYVGFVSIVTTGQDPKAALLAHVKSLGWDCNGVASDTPYTSEVLDFLRTRKVGTTGAGWPLSNWHLKLLMGLPPKLPREGVGSRLIGNVLVWVDSAEDAKRLNPGRARPHRIRAQCPHCLKDIPAGRLAQHMKVH